MARFDIYEAPIFNYYQDIINFNKEALRKPENDGRKTALNLNIILCSACLIEGVLEDRGKILLGYYRDIFDTINIPEFELRKPMNHFFNNIEEHLHKKVSQSTGLDNYASLFELFTGTSMKQHKKIKPLYEGVNVLFQLRNVIAHGRLIHAYDVEAYYTNGIEEFFCGGYKKAEDYLIKKGLLSDRFRDVEGSSLYFSNEIAEHFDTISHSFISALDAYIVESLQVGDILQESLKEYNTKNSTNYDIMSYLRFRGISK